LTEVLFQAATIFVAFLDLAGLQHREIITVQIVSRWTCNAKGQTIFISKNIFFSHCESYSDERTLTISAHKHKMICI